MVTIKYPAVYDISHWIPVADFRALDPMPWLVITKATEGTTLLDATYAEYADAIRDAGYRLGAFHFMRPGDPIAQADWFCKIIQGVGLRGNEVLACDMEVPGISLTQIKAFIDRTQSKTGIRPLIYSTQNMIEGLYIKGVCPAWLKAEWLWIAEYPGNPDLTNEIPTWIVPRGLTVNNIALWQYSDDGIVQGVGGNNVDLNLINPTYAQAINLTEPTPGEEPDMSTVLYKADLIAGQVSNVRTAAGLTATIKGNVSGPVTVEIISQKIVRDGYDWYQIQSPTQGYIALTSAYTNFRSAETTPPPSELPVLKVSISSPGYVPVDVELKPLP